jgi:uncharacterized membrane protein
MISRDRRIQPFQELENRKNGEKQGSILASLGEILRFGGLDLLVNYWTWVLQIVAASAHKCELICVIRAWRTVGIQRINCSSPSSRHECPPRVRIIAA